MKREYNTGLEIKISERGEYMCPFCGCDWLILRHMEWNGEIDGNIAPQVWTWECPHCGEDVQTLEYDD